VKMLRVLEMREITPLGTNEVRPVDLRVVAAVKVDLSDPAARGDFREDLYYRLNVVTLSIPPLRERREDIPLLFSYFAERAARRFGKQPPPVGGAVVDALVKRDWPGNVRELAHAAERYVLGLETPAVRADQQLDAVGGKSLPERLESMEAEVIRATLTRHRGDVQETLAELGIPRKTFYDKLQRHGINRSDYAG
jgi:two-component system, NtrC family, C4-dicarboxylate transport response regulator DctD